MRLTLAAFPFFSFSVAASFSCCCSFSSWPHQLSHFRVETQPLALPLRLRHAICVIITYTHIHTQRLQNIAGVCNFDFDYQFVYRLQLAAATAWEMRYTQQAATATVAMNYCRALPHRRRSGVWSVCGTCEECVCGTCVECVSCVRGECNLQSVQINVGVLRCL